MDQLSILLHFSSCAQCADAAVCSLLDTSRYEPQPPKLRHCIPTQVFTPGLFRRYLGAHGSLASIGCRHRRVGLTTHIHCFALMETTGDLEFAPKLPKRVMRGMDGLYLLRPGKAPCSSGNILGLRDMYARRRCLLGTDGTMSCIYPPDTFLLQFSQGFSGPTYVAGHGARSTQHDAPTPCRGRCLSCHCTSFHFCKPTSAQPPHNTQQITTQDLHKLSYARDITFYFLISFYIRRTCCQLLRWQHASRGTAPYMTQHHFGEDGMVCGHGDPLTLKPSRNSQSPAAHI